MQNTSQSPVNRSRSRAKSLGRRSYRYCTVASGAAPRAWRGATTPRRRTVSQLCERVRARPGWSAARGGTRRLLRRQRWTPRQLAGAAAARQKIRRARRWLSRPRAGAAAARTSGSCFYSLRYDSSARFLWLAASTELRAARSARREGERVARHEGLHLQHNASQTRRKGEGRVSVGQRVPLI